MSPALDGGIACAVSWIRRLPTSRSHDTSLVLIQSSTTGRSVLDGLPPDLPRGAEVQLPELAQLRRDDADLCAYGLKGKAQVGPQNLDRLCDGGKDTELFRGRDEFADEGCEALHL
jgi:hypothetical protein